MAEYTQLASSPGEEAAFLAYSCSVVPPSADVGYKVILQFIDEAWNILFIVFVNANSKFSIFV